jgi:amidohydrolase
MRSKQQLIQDVLAAIDASREKIIGIGTTVWKNPEPGYKEFKTSDLAAKTLTELGLSPKRKLSITGMRADLIGAKPGPSLAICGEMDSLILPSHPECDPATGAVHACGHNSHIATMLGAAIGLVQANAQNDISGKVAFIPCPAEECIETEWRSKLIKEGKIKALGGKASLILEGVFDDIDMSIMNHLGCAGYSVLDNNGFCMKNVTFHGKSAHAAGSPQHSINALSAANLALHALALLRETYSGDQYIRSHGILTHGGESVNIIPDIATIEYQLRAEKLDDGCKTTKSSQLQWRRFIAWQNNPSDLASLGHLPLHKGGFANMDRKLYRNCIE